MLGTYRPVEMALRAPPCAASSRSCGRGQAVDVRLELLPAEAVTAYVTERLGGRSPPPRRAHPRAHRGQCALLVNIVEHLVQQGWVVRRARAWTLRAGSEAGGESA